MLDSLLDDHYGTCLQHQWSGSRIESTGRCRLVQQWLFNLCQRVRSGRRRVRWQSGHQWKRSLLWWHFCRPTSCCRSFNHRLLSVLFKWNSNQYHFIWFNFFNTLRYFLNLLQLKWRPSDSITRRTVMNLSRPQWTLLMLATKASASFTRREPFKTCQSPIATSIMF